LTACVAVLLLPALPGLMERYARWRVHLLLRNRLPASHYTVLRDLTLRREGAGTDTVHVDHLVISPYGIFVVADCHVSGAIFGAERDAEWSRMGFRRKVAFPNPLRRCEEQIGALEQLLGIDHGMFHPLVVFTGDADARTSLPPHVTPLGGLIPYIQVRTGELLGFDEAARVAAVVRSRRLPPGVQVAAARINRRRRTEGQRFGAQQAVLGLALMAVLASVAGFLADNLSEVPGHYPDPMPQAEASPFVNGAPPPVIQLPGRSQPEPVRLRPEREAALLCTHSAENRRCACFEPGGGEVYISYDACRALAENGQRVSQR
jgi:hypothetical protein